MEEHVYTIDCVLCVPTVMVVSLLPLGFVDLHNLSFSSLLVFHTAGLTPAVRPHVLRLHYARTRYPGTLFRILLPSCPMFLVVSHCGRFPVLGVVDDCWSGSIQVHPAVVP